VILPNTGFGFSQEDVEVRNRWGKKLRVILANPVLKMMYASNWFKELLQPL